MASKVTYVWKGEEFKTAQRQAASRFVFRAAHMHRNECIRLIQQGTKSGRVYGKHQASAPGEPPATDLGRLVQAIHVKHGSGSLTALVVAGTAYAKLLEFGTSRMAPRPFMRPAAKNVRDDITALAIKPHRGT